MTASPAWRTTSETVGYFGAVHHSDGAFLASRSEELFNVENTFEFFKGLRNRERKGKREVVIIDNARYHHATLFKDWLEEVKDDLVLLFLPSYSLDFDD